MTETKRYLPSQLKNIVKDFRIAKDIDSCEVITHHGNRCKNATKYRFGDEIKDCGSYCTAHSNIWIRNLFFSLINGYINVDDAKISSYKINMFPLVKFGQIDISIKNGSIESVDFTDYIEEDGLNPEFSYVAKEHYITMNSLNKKTSQIESKNILIKKGLQIKEMKIKKGVKDKDINLDDIIEFIIQKMSLSKSIDIKIEFEYKRKGKKKEKIRNLNMDKIKGWYVRQQDSNITIEKTYNITEK